MRSLFFVLVLMVISGCASYRLSDVVSGQPIARYNSTKQPQEVVNCIKRGWQDFTPTFSREEGQGELVWSQLGETATNAAKVESSNSGTVIHLYEGAVLFNPRGFKETVEICL